MTWRIWLATIDLILSWFLLCCNVSYGDVGVFVSKDRKSAWILDTTTKMPIDIQVDFIYFEGEGGITPNPIPDPDPTPNPNPDPPPTDNTIKTISAFSKTYLNSYVEAQQLIAILDQFAGLIEAGTMTPAELAKNIDYVIAVLEINLKTAGRIKSWYGELKKLAAVPDAALLRKAIQGISVAYPVKPEKLLKQVHAGLDLTRSSLGETANPLPSEITAHAKAAAIEATVGEDPQRAFDIQQIIELILLILRIFGIGL